MSTSARAYYFCQFNPLPHSMPSEYYYVDVASPNRYSFDAHLPTAVACSRTEQRPCKTPLYCSALGRSVGRLLNVTTHESSTGIGIIQIQDAHTTTDNRHPFLIYSNSSVTNRPLFNGTAPASVAYSDRQPFGIDFQSGINWWPLEAQQWRVLQFPGECLMRKFNSVTRVEEGRN